MPFILTLTDSFILRHAQSNYLCVIASTKKCMYIYIHDYMHIYISNSIPERSPQWVHSRRQRYGYCFRPGPHWSNVFSDVTRDFFLSKDLTRESHSQHHT